MQFMQGFDCAIPKVLKLRNWSKCTISLFENYIVIATWKRGRRGPLRFLRWLFKSLSWDRSRSSSRETIHVDVGRHNSERHIWHEKRNRYCLRSCHDWGRRCSISAGAFSLRDTFRQCKHPPQILDVLWSGWESQHHLGSPAVLIDFLLMFTHHHRSSCPISQYQHRIKHLISLPETRVLGGRKLRS